MVAMRRPDTLTDIVTASEDVAAQGLAMAGFPDDFDTLPERRRAMIDPEPPLTGREVMDADLAALASAWHGTGT